MEEIKIICAQSRRKGSTDYLLRAAINDPNVTIVSITMSHSESMEQRYYQMLLKAPWYKRLHWFLAGRGKPIFTSLSIAEYSTPALSRPLIFDNSCFSCFS